MRIKRFEAADMTEALRLVKEEFGPDAVILSARTLKETKKGFSGLLKKDRVELTVAIDEADAEAPSESRPVREGSRTLVRQIIDTPKKLPGKAAAGRPQEASVRRPRKAADDCLEHARKLFPFYQQMLLQGVDESIAMDLTVSILKSVSEGELSDPEAVRASLDDQLTKMGLRGRKIKVGAGHQKFVAFVGPTGAGKTTTVAKFAAAARMSRKNDRVGLITLDNDRIGAIAQLRIYAKIIGVPLEVVSSRHTLNKALRKLRHKTVVFVDTPGISRGNSGQMNEVKPFLDELEPLETHMVLSANMQEREFRNLREIFDCLEIQSVIFSKVDESCGHGMILNHLIRSGLPFSYFTNSQQVPGGIHVASVSKIVDMLINEHTENLVGSVPPEILAENRKKLEDTLQEVKAGPILNKLHSFEQGSSFDELLETAQRAAYAS